MVYVIWLLRIWHMDHTHVVTWLVLIMPTWLMPIWLMLI